MTARASPTGLAVRTKRATSAPPPSHARAKSRLMSGGVITNPIGAPSPSPTHPLAAPRGGALRAAALGVPGVLSPVGGGFADQPRRRKPLLLACVLLGSAGTLGLALTPASAWHTMLAAFAVAFIAFATGNVIYDSLLPAVAEPGEMHRVSARGFAWGYVGGGILLAVNLAMITMPQRFGLHDAALATRAAFASVAGWWLAFSLPLFRDLPEPEAQPPGVPARGVPAPGERGRARQPDRQSTRPHSSHT